jgi:hypothetical protein
MNTEIFYLKLIKIINNMEIIYFIILNSSFKGLAEFAFPPIKSYSINYKWDVKPHVIPMAFNISLKGHT